MGAKFCNQAVGQAGAQRAVECWNLFQPSLKRLVAPSPWRAVAGAAALSRQVAGGTAVTSHSTPRLRF